MHRLTALNIFQNNMKNNFRIGFIGAGKVGTALGKYLNDNGFSITGYFSRSKNSADESAEFVGCTAFDSIGDLILNCDIIFVTTTDEAIKSVCDELQALGSDAVRGKVFCHTSGSISSEILNPLSDLGALSASMHMLLAVSDKFKSHSDFKNAFFTVEGNGIGALLKIIEHCGNRYIVIKPEFKAKYHAAAVFASNFVVALSHISCSLLTECGFSYNDAIASISPLLELNVKNIISQGPQKALTGPVERGDFETVKKHLECFDQTETDIAAKEVYKIMTHALMRQTGRNKN